MHFWPNPGNSIMWLRVSSLIPGLLFIPACYFLGKKALGPITAWLIALLAAFGLAPMTLSEVIRPYALVGLFLAGGLWFWFDFVASPVRAAARTGDGVWHVGGTWVESAGGGCTVSGATRKDGSWSRTLGEVSGRLFTSADATPGTLASEAAGARLRLRIMHPMDTGLVGGIPAFFVNRLSVRDGRDRELARVQSFEPVSENPVFSFDFSQPPEGGVRVVGSDNNGNRIGSALQ
jgi:hypothetical protein